MKSPLFGSFYISRSPNLADQQCVNLYPELVETKSGKEVGALYMTPGYDLFTTAGAGPIRAMRRFVGDSLLYVVSGSSLYSVNVNGTATLLGSVSNNGPVTMIDNGKQLGIFIDNGYIVPGGYPLTGGVVLAPGNQYQIGDTIYLTQSGGTQTATALVTVTGITGGTGVFSFNVTFGGAFPVQPTSFSQFSTSGNGSGFQLGTPTFGTFLHVVPITLPFTPGVAGISATYQDGFGVITQPNTNLLFQSNLLDLSIWNPLNFASASANSDLAIAAVQIHREMFIVKSQHTEVWTNQGQPGFTFARVDGVYLQFGILAQQSLVISGETLIFLAQNDAGEGIVVEIAGYRPSKVSTFAIDNQIAGYVAAGQASDAIAYAYQQGGHEFYVLTFPSVTPKGVTWVFDRTMSELAGVPLWHQRAFWDGTQFNRHLGNCYALYNDKSLIGDSTSGKIFIYNIATLTDNGGSRKWLRSWRALPQPSEPTVRFNSMRIDMQTGVNVTGNPTAGLRWSDDAGNTWSTSMSSNIGVAGGTANRVMYRRLGSTRQESGLDRIFELSGINSTTDACPIALIGAELEVAP